jgi:ribosomal protein S18 acetylase RimI-like enzyme
MSLYIRPRVPEDEPFLYQLAYDNFYEKLFAHTWAPNVRGPLLKLQVDGQRTSYAFEFPNADYGIIEYDGRNIGRLIVDRRPDQHYLVDILIAREYRKKGIGTWLMRALCTEAEMMQKPLRLSVLTNNPAKALYERLGFRMIEDREITWLMERVPGATVLVQP